MHLSFLQLLIFQRLQGLHFRLHTQPSIFLISLLSQAFMQFFCSERNCFQTFFQVCNNFFSSKATLKLEFFSVSNQRQISLTNRCRCKQLSELKAIVKLQTTQKHQAMLYSYICSLQRNTKIDK